jgi:Bacterial Ig-like domain (group 3)
MIRRAVGSLALLAASVGLAHAQSQSITLSASPAGSSTIGQAVTLTAQTQGIPQNSTINFFDGTTLLGSAATNANATATFTTSSLSVGTHSLVATFTPVGTINLPAPIRSNTIQYVVKAGTNTDLTSQPNPSTFGENVRITATVTPAAGAASGPTGSVTFLDGTTQIGTAQLSNGSASLNTANLSAGNHFLTANYSGDNNFAASSAKGITQTVNKRGTSTSLTVNPNPANTGQTVTMNASVAPAGATGSVTFFDGTTQLASMTIVNGNASFATSGLAAGTHTLTAIYNGDNNNNSSTSLPVNLTVNQPATATTTSLTANPNPANAGQAVTLTATVTPSNSTGTVTFRDGQTSIGTGTLSNGTATFTTSNLAAGTHSLTAVYGGDPTHNSSTSAAVNEVIKAATTTSLTASASSVAAGQPVTLTARVAPANATGTVTFSDGSFAVGAASVSNGIATFTTSSLAIGSHSLTAGYGGDASFSGSDSTPVTVTVTNAATTATLSASATSITVGQPVTFSVDVRPANATGTVTFVDGSTPIGTATLTNGSATFATSSLATGSHSISATYGGDNNFNGSTSNAVAVAVGQGSSATSLSVSSNPATAGQPVTLNAAVVPANASGTVTFKDGTANIGTSTVANGSATLILSNLSVGSHTLTATYNGDTTFTSSVSNAIVEVINAAINSTTVSLSLNPNPAAVGQPVTLNAVVFPGSATGSVTFKDGNTTVGTATVISGSATLVTSALTVGSHSLTATYGGDSANSAGTSQAVVEVINPANATVTLAASPVPANFGQTVTLTVTVSPSTSTGTVTVFDSVTAGTVGGTGTLVNGSATLTVSNLKVGQHSLQAFYSGPNNQTGQSNFVIETITPAPTTTTLTVSSNFTMTALVTPAAATGTVTFKDGATTLGTATLSNGTATFSGATLGAGSHTLTATYNGDGNFAPGTSNPVTVTPGLPGTTTTLTASPNSPAPGQAVTLTATVSPSTATGTVTFMDGTASLGTATLSGGTASLTTSALASGTHSLSAAYGGDTHNGPSTSSAVNLTVGLPPTRVVLTASPNPSTAGQAVTLTASTTPATATGTVTFVEGSTTLGTATLSGGAATLIVSTLPAGNHTLTANYGGDANNAPAASNSIAQTVNTGTALQISPGTILAAFVNTPYSQTFTASGGTPPMTWSLVSGTSELSVTTSANNGILAGTPRTAGTADRPMRRFRLP